VHFKERLITGIALIFLTIIFKVTIIFRFELIYSLALGILMKMLFHKTKNQQNFEK